MRHHAEATLGGPVVEFGWAPCFKVGSETWHLPPNQVKVVSDQHFVKIPRTHGSTGFRCILAAVSDGSVDSNCNLIRSNGYAKLVELRDEAVADMEMASELDKLPKWQAGHVAKTKPQKKPKRKRFDQSTEESCILDVELKLEAFDDPVTVRVLSDSNGGEMLWIEMTAQSMLYIAQCIVEHGFAEDRLFRSYVRRHVPKGVIVVPPRGPKQLERFRVKLPNSAVIEATAMDGSKTPRKSVACKTLEEAQAVLNDPIAYVFPAAIDEVHDEPDNSDADDPDEPAAGEVNANIGQ